MWRHTIEQLESRRLLSVSVERALMSGEIRPTAESPAPPASVAPAPAHAAAVAAAAAATAAAPQVDAVAVRDELIRFVDTWNGGQAGRNGTSGMGVYATTWDGLFRMNLNRQFNPISYYTNDQTIISQSRATYINVEAYRNAPSTDRARFKTAVQKGADYLLAKARDPVLYNGNPGGMWWGLQPDGVSPPTHTTAIYGTAPRHKDAYGQVQSLFALAHAYSVTADVDHLNGAFAQLDVWNTQFADTAAGPGAFLPTANENYTQRVDTRNLDYMTHALEALLALDAVTPAAHPRKAQLAPQIASIGNFITTRMYRDAAGSTTMGYLPWYYDAAWNPSSTATQQYVTPGHNLEVAYLLSRAVERGFNPAWLPVANKLIAFALKYGFDNTPGSPTYGVVRYEKLKFDGTPFNATPDKLVWWQTSEAARTLLHFALVRGRADLSDEYDAAIAFIRNRFVDSVYGGWFTSLDPVTLAPTTTNKGTVWTGGYHEAMLYAEMLRLAKPPPPTQSTPFSGTPIAIPSTGSATIQAEHFDNGGEGVAFHDTDAVNSGNVYRATGVDLAAASDVGGGYLVGWTRAGEWLNYTVNVATAGSYDFDFRVAAPAAGGKFHLEVDGANVTGALTAPNTGGWQAWQTLRKTAVPLPAGTHRLRLAMDATVTSGVANFNYIKVTRSGTPTSTTTLKSNTAAFVRDGSFAWTNYGGNASLEVKKSTTGYNRETYIRFDLSAAATISSAKLRLFGKLSDTAASSLTIGVYGSGSTTWTESGLTWSNRPATGAAPLASFSVSGTTAKWYEVDVTSYLKAEKAAGRNVVTLVLRSQTSSATVCAFSSDETASGPELRVVA
jgi:mannose/cellobiose epimerase-like protein (N-acyl-D-glucosamine 2-epimerase family)